MSEHPAPTLSHVHSLTQVLGFLLRTQKKREEKNNFSKIFFDDSNMDSLLLSQFTNIFSQTIRTRKKLAFSLLNEFIFNLTYTYAIIMAFKHSKKNSKIIVSFLK